MREIRFRGWDTKAKRMCHAFWIGSVSGQVRQVVQQSEDSESATLGSPANFELMQFTGLKDKNGKEIYEGDIVAGKESRIFVGDWNTYINKRSEKRIIYETQEVESHFGRRICVVEWENELACWHPFASYEEREWDKDVEVVGNIYENPEYEK